VKTSLNVSIFEQGTPIESMISRTAQAGFSAVELALTVDGPLTLESSRADCIRIAKCAHSEGLDISALTVAGLWETAFAAPDPAQRKTGYRQAVAALDRAAWLGTNALITVPDAGPPPAPTSPQSSPEDAYTWALETLLDLRFEAEQRAVQLACGDCWNRYLTSPLEGRTFIDHVNSPWVGACLDLADILPRGRPQDWIRTLARRVFRVYFHDARRHAPPPERPCPLGEGDVDWTEVTAALEQVRYGGPITCHGPGAPADVAARLAGVLRSADGATAPSDKL
jgi:hexulose-6-phosphate isomerase